MKIAIVGPGKLGSALAKLWSGKGHEVSVTFSRDPEKLKTIASQTGAEARSVTDAVAACDVVVLTTKWAIVPTFLADAGALKGKIVIDCTNTMSPRKTAEGLPETRSCAEVLAAMIPEAHVVKTLNQVFEQILHADSRLFGADRPTTFYCGDDAGAMSAAAQLIADADLEPVSAGPLENARYVEAYAVLMLRLGHTLGLGTNIAMKLLRR